MTTLQLIAARRRTLADQLDGLSAKQWETQSLCEAWTVREVVGHMVMPFTHSMRQALFGILRAGGSWDRFSERASSGNAARPTDELVQMLRDHAEDPWSPPGGGHIGALTDLVVHSLDIARPCGFDPELDKATAGAVLDSVVGQKSVKAFGVDLSAVRLEASDVDWSHGDGRLVRGPAAELIVALTGRVGACLEGPGAQLL